MADEKPEVTDPKPGEAEGDGDKGGATPKGWHTMAPEKYRERLAGLGLGTPEEFWERTFEAHDRSKSALVKPGDDAAPEQWEEFWKAVGRPDTPDGYDLTAPEGVTLDDNLTAEFRKKALELGAPKAIAEPLFKWYVAEQAKSDAARTEQAAQEIEKQLRSEWGKDYDRNVAVVGGFINKAFDEEFFAYLDEKGISNDPRFIKGMMKTAMANREGRFIGGNPPSEKPLTQDEKLKRHYQKSHEKKGW